MFEWLCLGWSCLGFGFVVLFLIFVVVKALAFRYFGFMCGLGGLLV